MAMMLLTACFLSTPPLHKPLHRRKALYSCSVLPEPVQHRSTPRTKFRTALNSLNTGTWFKLICGASSHDVTLIRDLSAIYTAAGVDCIDVACDRAIIHAATTGITRGLQFRAVQGPPLVMVSVNASSDPHFRKAIFDATKCPADCPRPCEKICPADAINAHGVLKDKCYGCGRCVPVCPLGLVDTVETVYDTGYIKNILMDDNVNAVEIHVGREQEREFRKLWKDIGDAASGLQVVAVSFPDLGGDEALKEGLEGMWKTMAADGSGVGTDGAMLIWQTDGRAMSGDIGRGTAKAAVQLGGRVRGILNELQIPGEVQLAGGTNDATVGLMERAGLRRCGVARVDSAAGIAVGGHARKIVRDALESMEEKKGAEWESAFRGAVSVAQGIVNTIKR